MDTEYQPDSYSGECSVCGSVGDFVREARAIRETYRCPTCRASLRERAQARCILDVIAPALPSLAEAGNRRVLESLKIYEPGTIGPFRTYFGSLKGYQQSDYYPEDRRADATAQVPHQDLEAITFATGAFDLGAIVKSGV